MSDQRRLRSELKQGLHQFTMTLYNSYRQTLSHDKSVEQISNCLIEEYEYLTKQVMKQEKTFNLGSLVEKVEKRAKDEKDPVKQFELYEDVESLLRAQELVTKYETGKDNK
ncbi:hypothetical protein [Bacillus sp. 'calajunan']|uniref:hypothetical protein n=1 Tax=Bacillus sp. 'calajunan' TaxID=3447457 RepID=UPI003EE0D6A3